jgi:hypothetical protein
MDVASFKGAPGNLAGDKNLRGTGGSHRGGYIEQEAKEEARMSRRCEGSPGTRIRAQKRRRRKDGDEIDEIHRRN